MYDSHHHAARYHSFGLQIKVFTSDLAFGWLQRKGKGKGKLSLC
jgi:hypothetical protein